MLSKAIAIANQLYGVVATVGGNKSQLEELISNKENFN